MVDVKKIIGEALEYINNNLTVEETAKKLGISKSTLQKHFAIIRDIAPNLYDLVKHKQEVNHQKGVVLGGQNGKVKVRYTQEQAIAIANAIINDELSYEEASEIYGVAKSTIYEMTHSEYVDEETKKQLDTVAYAHRKKIAVSELEEENKRVRVTY